jgi:hypothetical protein
MRRINGIKNSPLHFCCHAGLVVATLREDSHRDPASSLDSFSPIAVEDMLRRNEANILDCQKEAQIPPLEKGDEGGF